MTGVATRGWAGARERLLARERRPSPAGLGLVVLLAATATLLLWFGRGSTLYYDEWSTWLARWDLTFDNLLRPFNDHNSAVPILLYDIAGRLPGYDPAAFRVTFAIAHVTLLALFWNVVKHRLGGWFALALTAPLALVGAAWLPLLMPWTGLVFALPLIALLGAMLLIERQTLRADIGAAALLTMGLYSSGEGLAALAGIAVLLLLPRPDWRRLWVIAAPAVAWLVWYLMKSPESEASVQKLELVTSYVAEGLAHGSGAYTTLGADFGRALGVAVAVLVIARLAREAVIDRWLACGVVAAVAYWALLALGRGPELHPDEVRYQYANVVFVALLVGLAARALPRNPAALALAALLAVAFAYPSVDAFRVAAQGYRGDSQEMRAKLYAIEVARDVVDPSYSPMPERDPIFSTGLYLEALADGRSLAYEESEIPPTLLPHVDGALVEALRLGPEPAAPGDATGACRTLEPGRGLELQASDRLLVDASRAGVAIRFRRYAPTFAGDPQMSAPGRQVSVVRIPRDRSSRPWHARFESETPARVCGAAG